MGDSTSYAFDSEGNQTLVIQGYGTSAAATTRYAFDPAGNQTLEVDPAGNTTSYAFDPDGNQTLMVDPLGHTTAYAFDPDGRLVGQSNPDGSSLALTYDPQGNLLSETWYAPGGAVADVRHYTYDNDGNLLTAGNSAGTYTFAYDGDGNSTLAIDPNGVTLTYQYDPNGQVTQVVNSLGGTFTMQYDAEGQLTQQGYSGPDGAQLLEQLSYDGAGNLIGVQRYADLAGTQLVGSTSETYNPLGLVSSITTKDATGNVLESFGYVYDGAGELTSEVDNGVTTAYSYDATGQLLSAGTASYQYDANGNPTNTGDSTGTGNQLLSDGTWNYNYDAKGNLIGKTGISNGLTWTYSYDVGNELTGATETNAQGQVLVQASYAFDVFGNRIESSISTDGGAAVVTKYAYNGNTLWAELSSSGALQTVYVSGDQPDQWLARVDAGGNVHWYLTDHLGSVRGIMNNAGTLLDQINYDAYGNITTQTDPTVGGSLLYAGYSWDSALGAFHDGAREYGPDLGRFWSVDFLGLGPDTNYYRYTGNQPTDRTDPSGQQAYALGEAARQIIMKGLGEGAYSVQVGKIWYPGTKINYTLWLILARAGVGMKGPDADAVNTALRSPMDRGTVFYDSALPGRLSSMGLGVNELNTVEERLAVFKANLAFYGKRAKESIGYQDFKEQGWKQAGLGAVFAQVLMEYGSEGQELLNFAIAKGVAIGGDNDGYTFYEKYYSQGRITLAESKRRGLKRATTVEEAAKYLYTLLKDHKEDIKRWADENHHDKTSAAQMSDRMTDPWTGRPMPVHVGGRGGLARGFDDLRTEAAGQVRDLMWQYALSGLSVRTSAPARAATTERQVQVWSTQARKALTRDAKAVQRAGQAPQVVQKAKSASTSVEAVIGGTRTSQTSLDGLRAARKLTKGRLQGNASTCGLYSAISAIEDVRAAKAPIDFSGLRDQIRINGGTGLKSIQVRDFIIANLPDAAVLLERGVTEEKLLEALRRGPVLSHVDGNHWVRVLGTVKEGRTTWARIYDPARGNYEQLLTSFMTRTCTGVSENQMIFVRP